MFIAWSIWSHLIYDDPRRQGVWGMPWTIWTSHLMILMPLVHSPNQMPKTLGRQPKIWTPGPFSNLRRSNHQSIGAMEHGFMAPHPAGPFLQRFNALLKANSGPKFHDQLPNSVSLQRPTRHLQLRAPSMWPWQWEPWQWDEVQPYRPKQLGSHLVGGWLTPLKNIWVKVSWDELLFPRYGKS